MKLICKTTILAPEPPPFVGTVLRVEVPPEKAAFGIFSATLAEGSTGITVDWGDETPPQVVTSDDFPLIHTYAAAGRYEIRLSDDIAALGVSSTTSSVVGEYKLFLIGVEITAKRLVEIAGFCFYNCGNLLGFAAPDNNIAIIGSCSFTNCGKLVSPIFLPDLVEFAGSGSKAPFRGDEGILEIHLGGANEETIRALPNFADNPTLGAPNATLSFDL